MSTILEQIQYGFDRNSRRIWLRRSLTDTQDQHYGYDSLGQVSASARGSLNMNLTAISGRPASAQSWDYDPTGNWRGYHSAANGTPTLDQYRVHDRGNRLTQIEDNPNNMILDRVGRMRQMAPDADGDWDGTLELTWDAWSRITRVKNNGVVVGDYAYDGSHRRITREVDGEALHSYYNDAWRPVEERKDAETTAAMSYLWGARHRDDLVRRDRAVGGTTLNETRYVLMDYFNPAAITDEAGEVKERYAFSAFGLRTILNPDFTERSSSECGMEFAFQGQLLDAESGLMNYGYRYYSPQLGRWTCKDPIGEQGGLNLYELVRNEPVNHIDHLGLQALPNCCCILGVDVKSDGQFEGGKAMRDYYPQLHAQGQDYWGRTADDTSGPFNQPRYSGVKVQLIGKTAGDSTKCKFEQWVWVDLEMVDGKEIRPHGENHRDFSGRNVDSEPLRQMINGQPSWADAPAVVNLPNTAIKKYFTSCVRSGGDNVIKCQRQKCCVKWYVEASVSTTGIPSKPIVKEVEKWCE